MYSQQLNSKKDLQDSRPAAESRIIRVDEAQVAYGAGFEVKDVQTGFETRKIIMKNVPTSIDSTALQDILRPFGDVQEVQLPDPKPKFPSMLVRASFATHTEATSAVNALNGARIDGRDIVVQLATHKSTAVGKGTVVDGDICIEFPTPCIAGLVEMSSLTMEKRNIF